MARLNGITFTGPLGNMTAYTMRGVEGIIVRRKGGPSKERIKNDPQFARTRENNAEFGGRSATARGIIRVLQPLSPLKDYNFAGALNACLRPVQVADSTQERGQRSVQLSRLPGVLEGFSLNRKMPLESVVKTPPVCVIHRNALSAEVHIPALIPRVNLMPVARYSVYGFQAVFGLVPDHFFTPRGYAPSHEAYVPATSAVEAKTAWFSTTRGSESVTLSLTKNFTPPDDHFTLFVAVGVRFGGLNAEGSMDRGQYVGTAKVMKVSGREEPGG